MTLEYPACFQPDCTGELVVSFRDLPECLTSGANEEEAFLEARDALKVAIAARLDKRRGVWLLHSFKTRKGGERDDR